LPRCRPETVVVGAIVSTAAIGPSRHNCAELTICEIWAVTSREDQTPNLFYRHQDKPNNAWHGASVPSNRLRCWKQERNWCGELEAAGRLGLLRANMCQSGSASQEPRASATAMLKSKHSSPNTARNCSTCGCRKASAIPNAITRESLEKGLAIWPTSPHLSSAVAFGHRHRQGR
jgi:hypothetical protein